MLTVHQHTCRLYPQISLFVPRVLECGGELARSVTWCQNLADMVRSKTLRLACSVQVVLFAVTGLAGCGNDQGKGNDGGLGGAGAIAERWELEPATAYVEPEGVFELVEARGEAPDILPTVVEVRLIDGEISFSGACNSYWGEYSFDDQTLGLTDGWGGTQAGCDSRRELISGFILEFLSDAPRASWHGEHMVLSTGEAALLFEQTEEAHPDWPLVGTYWGISEGTDSTEDPAETHELYGNFMLNENGEFDVRGGCLSIDGEYEETRDGFLIKSIDVDDEQCEEEAGYNPIEPIEFLAEFFVPGEVEARIVDRHLYLTRDGRELICPPPR